MQKKITILLCAAAWISSSVNALELPVVQVRGAEYLNLSAYAAAHGLSMRWDPVSRNAFFLDSPEDLRFHDGSEYLLNRDKLFKLAGKALMKDGSLLVPLSARAQMDDFFAPIRPARRRLDKELPVYVEKTALPPPHRVRRIVVDAGHGGKDTGAISPYGLKEKRLSLDLARRIRESLQAHGLEVVMTRDADIYLPLEERARIANRSQADFFVSVHANASESRSMSGFEIYTLSEETDDWSLAAERAGQSVPRGESHALAGHALKTTLWDLTESENRRQSLRLAGHMLEAVSRSTQIGPRRLRQANFYVLKWTECPAVLVEMGYLTNRTDERLLRSSLYKDDLAEAVVRGILRYKDEYESMNGFTE